MFPHKVLLNHKWKIDNFRMEISIRKLDLVKVNITNDGTAWRHVPSVRHWEEFSIISVRFLPRRHGLSLVTGRHQMDPGWGASCRMKGPYSKTIQDLSDRGNLRNSSRLKLPIIPPLFFHLHLLGFGECSMIVGIKFENHMGWWGEVG